MTKNTLRIKLMMGIGSVLLCTSELSVATEEQLFEYELTQSGGHNMENVNDAVGAQSALNFLSSWVNNPNSTIKQKALQTAEALVKKWELDPPSWLPGIIPQAEATTEQIYREVSSQMPDEPSELTEVKKELKDVIEAEALHAEVEEGTLPTLLPKSLVEDLIKQHPEAQQQAEEARRKREAEKEEERQREQREQEEQELHKKLEDEQQVEKKEQERGDREAKREEERQVQQREQAQQELDKKLEAEQKVEKEEQARRDREAKAKIEALLEEKKNEPLPIVEAKMDVKEVMEADVFQVKEEVLPANLPQQAEKLPKQREEILQAEVQKQGQELGQARPTIGKRLVEGAEELVEGAIKGVKDLLGV